MAHGLTASDAGRYALVAVYVETDDESKWPGRAFQAPSIAQQALQKDRLARVFTNKSPLQ